MKKYFLTLFGIFLSLQSISAQEEDSSYGFIKDDVYISGSLFYEEQNSDGFEGSSFSFSPEIAYFVSGDFSLRAALLFGKTNFENFFQEGTAKSFGVSLGADYYTSPKERLSFVFGADFSYLTQNRTSNNNELPELTVLAFTFSPGINYFVSKSVALRAKLGAFSFRSSKQDTNNAESDNSFNINMNLSNINLGIVFKI